MWAELFVTEGNLAGLKEDHGFFQHCHGMGPTHEFIGPYGMLYDGGYGSGLTLYLLQWIGLTAQLQPFELPHSGYEGLGRLVLDGQEWMIAGTTAPHWDVSVIGRELARPGHTIPWDPATVAAVGGPRADEFAQLARRLNHSRSAPLSVGHRQFFRGDYAVHRTETWSVHVRTFSTRTINTECIAHENKQGKHLGAGVTFVYQDGAEYSETYPLWDWKTLPAVTTELDGNTLCLENTSFPPDNNSCWINCHNTQHQGTRAFVGGVSSGTVGLIAFDFSSPFHYSSLAYRQVWLFCGGFYVILFTGISRTAPTLPVVTGVAQRRQSGLVHVSGRNTSLPDGNHTMPCTSGSWLHHGDVGYAFIGMDGVGSSSGKEGGNNSDRSGFQLSVTSGIERGNWSTIGFHTDAANASMFRAFLNHPPSPTPSDLAMVVQPGIAFADWAPNTFLDRDHVDIVSNAADKQAVLFATEGVFGAAFYAVGSITLAGRGHKGMWTFSVTAADPCALLVEELQQHSTRPFAEGTEGEGESASDADSAYSIMVSLSDPSQTLTSASVTFAGLCLAGPGCGLCIDGNTTTLEVQFPQGTRAGDSVAARCTVAATRPPVPTRH